MPFSGELSLQFLRTHLCPQYSSLGDRLAVPISPQRPGFFHCVSQHDGVQLISVTQPKRGEPIVFSQVLRLESLGEDHDLLTCRGCHTRGCGWFYRGLVIDVSGQPIQSNLRGPSSLIQRGVFRH